jgi:hypothetical protein
LGGGGGDRQRFRGWMISSSWIETENRPDSMTGERGDGGEGEGGDPINGDKKEED